MTNHDDGNAQGMQETTLTDFLLARIAEDEAAARAVPPLDHNYDMGGNRQDERWIFDRTLPSSADGMGNWSKHRHEPTTAAHFSRHDPARVLARCAADRRIVELAWESEVTAEGEWGRGRSRDQMEVEGLYPDILYALGTVYADHPDYRPEWAL